MPIYEFKCDNCKLTFEKIFSRVSKNQQEDCPDCGNKANRIPSLTNFKMKESTSIPKEIDLKVGADAEKRWLEYEDRKSVKEKIRKENNTSRLSRDLNGNYSPVSVTSEGKVVSESEAVELRNKMYDEYQSVKKDPNSEKIEVADE